MPMKVKITVLAVDFKADLWDAYITEPPATCPYFTVGQSFMIEEFAMPEGFCTWAWNDIFYAFHSVWVGGDSYPWYKEHGVSVVCCTDATRPVTFKIERVDDV
jgi:uncharacterized repeat protein (TIGR04076 family)